MQRSERLEIVQIAACRDRVIASRRLSNDERQAMLDLAHSERFADLSVREIYATLLDEGRYIGFDLHVVSRVCALLAKRVNDAV